MKKIIDLKDLLKHEILDLYSAEEQIIDGLLEMIQRASDPRLGEALNNHLEATKTHKDRLDKIKETLMSADDTEDSGGFFSKLFGGSNAVTCKGIAGILEEAGEMMSEDMTPEAMDAAIIGSAQKIAHYEIAGYGTVRAYASELKLDFIKTELDKTLQEEYAADDALTKLAIGEVNPDAEKAVYDESTNEDDYARLTNSVSIMTSSDSAEDEE